MGNRPAVSAHGPDRPIRRSSSMSAKLSTKLAVTNSFVSVREPTLSRLSSGAKTGWPVPQREGVFLPEYPSKPSIDFTDFRILGHIGRGAFGHVLKAQSKGTGEIYAMKVLDKLEIFRHKAVQQCKDEIKIQSSFMCPFIVHARHAWQTKRHLYIILDYSERGDLFAVWTRVRRFDERSVQQYVAEMAVALDFLHRAGVIYRDLKLENVLLDSSGHIKLTDFGLSKWLKVGFKTRTICGTIQYMAPEILNNESYTHAVDWWSMGVLMYAMLVGEYPFNSTQSHKAMYEAILSGTCVYPLFLSGSAVAAIRRFLCVDPKKRLASLLQLRTEPFFSRIYFDELIQRAKVKLKKTTNWNSKVSFKYGKNVNEEPKKAMKNIAFMKETHEIKKEKDKEKHHKRKKGKLKERESSPPETVKYKPRHWGSGLNINSNSDKLSLDARLSSRIRSSVAASVVTDLDSESGQFKDFSYMRPAPSLQTLPSANSVTSGRNSRNHHRYLPSHQQPRGRAGTTGGGGGTGDRHHHQHHHHRHQQQQQQRQHKEIRPPPLHGSTKSVALGDIHHGHFPPLSSQLRQQHGHHKHEHRRVKQRSSWVVGNWDNEGSSSSDSEGDVAWTGFGVL
eukprot:m.22554 g.22554  ORF g.22554 m.22554 type:complete len:618 (+) comp28355_c0_seq2:82-1935(+)